jgi:UDP-N-acetylmuramoyl-tripeptide--D-alanyl-D-alanine ligase
VLNLADVLDATGGVLHGSTAKNLRFTRVVVDSRAVERGVLFVALKGERADGHDFVQRAFAAGAGGAIVERVPSDAPHEGAVLIQVKSSAAALADMARFALARHPSLEVVGITGSLGKTTTKEVTASVLGQQRRVLKSEGNLNSEIGLPMTVLNGLQPEHEIAVLEMGMYQTGDVRFLAQLARPRIGVVTAVQPVHLERMGTIERIQEAKQELVEELPRDGVAVLNADDPRVAQMANATSARVVRYGVSESAEVRAANIESLGLSGVEFDLLHGGERRHVDLPLLGTHNVYPALAAAAVAIQEDFSPSDIAAALHDLSPTLRLLIADGINGSRLVDDSYNASPESVIAALNVLRELPGGKKIAVLGDMLELGSEEEPAHRRVGRHAASVVDMLVVYGPRSHATAREAISAGLRTEQVLELGSHEEIIGLLRDELRAGDDVLVKGSLGMGMRKVVDGIRAKGEG